MKEANLIINYIHQLKLSMTWPLLFGTVCSRGLVLQKKLITVVQLGCWESFCLYLIPLALI